MSNVIKFERPPEPEAPKQKKAISPALRKALIWLCLLLAFVGAWLYFTLLGGGGATA